MTPVLADAVKLFHEGSMAFSAMEANGIRMDVPYLTSTIAALGTRITNLEERLMAHEVYDTWRKRYGKDANLDARDQLGAVLFEDMAYPYPAVIKEEHERAKAKGKIKAGARLPYDEQVLEYVDIPFTKNYIKCQKLKKLKTTYLEGFYREVEGEYLHPFFNLHRVTTYRSSSSEPNFQNVPIRDKEIGQLIRTAFISRAGRRLIEVDLSGAEVRVAACYHKDPTMLSDLATGYDMHADMAEECYLVDRKLYADKKVFKEVRQEAKGKFTFAQFYGDYYIACAASLWEAATQQELVDHLGRPLKQHLQEKFSKLGSLNPDDKLEPGTFVAHLKAVEDRFWKKRYKVYDQWRRDWYNLYLERGYFNTLTGFQVRGQWSRNFVINCPVQGSAFHCLLWAIIQINKEIKRRGMKTLLVGQIHDSLVADVPDDEVDDYLAIVRRTLMEDLPKHWEWIIAGIELEASVCPVGGNWHQKEVVEV